MKRRFAPVLALIVLTAALAAWALAPGAVAQPSAQAATTKVTVTATEFKFKLSRTSVPHGVVVFTIMNKGHLPHDFKVLGKKSAMVKPGKTAKLTVTAKAGKYKYLCTVPGHAAAGMKGTLTVK